MQDWLEKVGQGTAGLAEVGRTRNCRSGWSRENKERAGLAGVGRARKCRICWIREDKRLQDWLE